ncbi:hypothetical protein LMANV2_750002 [Leptospira interrogans serovar Manilae]|uniref:Uncharacterized protein n=1 Tax=Leptospira interrogans serovar Manilae TaxID=214675 RepID=A0AAQ1P391_LEPIR|nr:hypothetical protein LMANV2_750002 [Leptospira interrogans serovar Manilae]
MIHKISHKILFLNHQISINVNQYKEFIFLKKARIYILQIDS